MKNYKPELEALEQRLLLDSTWVGQGPTPPPGALITTINDGSHGQYYQVATYTMASGMKVIQASYAPGEWEAVATPMGGGPSLASDPNAIVFPQTQAAGPPAGIPHTSIPDPPFGIRYDWVDSSGIDWAQWAQADGSYTIPAADPERSPSLWQHPPSNQPPQGAAITQISAGYTVATWSEHDAQGVLHKYAQPNYGTGWLGSVEVLSDLNNINTPYPLL